jgi:HK97 family phage prohead protease
MTGAIAVDVVRALSAAPELRGAEKDEDSIGILSGHFSAFNNWYRVSSAWEGDFLERIAPGAFAKTIVEDRAGMRVLFDHGFDPHLGNKVLGPIRELREEDEGGYYEVPLFDTSYNRDLLPGLRANQYGASFRMKVEADEWDDKPEASDFNPDGKPLRTITRSKVMEFGPVTFPANPQASAGVRSATDEFYTRLQAKDRGAYEAACRAANIQLPDFAAADPRHERGGGSGHDDGRDVGVASARSEAEARHTTLILLGVFDHV